MTKGKKLDYETFMVAFTSSLQHKDYLPELVDTLLNYEQFHTAKSYNSLHDVLKAAHKAKLYESPDGLRLIKAIQLKFAMDF